MGMTLHDIRYRHTLPGAKWSLLFNAGRVRLRIPPELVSLDYLLVHGPYYSLKLEQWVVKYNNTPFDQIRWQ